MSSHPCVFTMAGCFKSLGGITWHTADDDATQNTALHAAVEELAAEGLVETHDDTVILTAKGQEAIA